MNVVQLCMNWWSPARLLRFYQAGSECIHAKHTRLEIPFCRAETNTSVGLYNNNLAYLKVMFFYSMSQVMDK